MIEAKYSESAKNLTLQSAYLLYGSGSNTVSHITEHPVSIINGRPVLMEGKTASAKSMKKFASSVLKIKVKQLCFIPPNVIAMDEESLVWWVPAQKTRVFFKTPVKGLENVSAEVENPPLLFAIKNSKWYVFALPDNVRPTPDTELLFSPFFNVWDNHQICVGSTTLPKSNDVHEWTKAFFSSAFTHTNYKSKPANLLKGTRSSLWRRLCSGKLKKFPVKVLPKAGITLGGFLKEISK